MADELFLSNLGKRVAERRKELGLTQETLAEQVDLSLQSVSCIELGKKAVRPDNLVKISAVLGVSTDYLLTGKRDDEKTSELFQRLQSLPDRDYDIVEELIGRFSENV